MSESASWMRQIEKPPKGLTGAASGDYCCCSDLSKEVWGDRLHDNSGLTAFAYLWRRFGPPWHGTDAHKRLGSYILGTPADDVFLWVDPSGSSAEYATGYLVTKAREEKIWQPCVEWEAAFGEWWFKTNHPTAEEPYSEALKQEFTEARFDQATCRKAVAAIGEHPRRREDFYKRPVVTEVHDALRAAMRELLRPVYIRDVPINILGRCDETDEPAERSKYAGFGVPREAMDELIARAGASA